MKAVSGTLPEDDEHWAFEIKWDGMRILSFVERDGKVRLRSANGIDSTNRYPELRALGEVLAGQAAVLDGEVVAFDDDGRPSFGRLQGRMHLSSSAEVTRRAGAVPISYVVFDLLRLDGNDVFPLPYLERRRLLFEVVSEGGCWQVPSHRVGDGALLLDAARERGLEGVMAKRIDSPYLPGKRSAAWRKIKVRKRQELVVGGWQPGEGNRTGRMGSLLLGYYDQGSLRFAGKVGTGFSTYELDRLGRLLQARATDESPFDPPPPRQVTRAARWVQPELVAEIEFGEWTEDGILRHPTYLGLRDDKPARDVVREV